ncbi:penicillin-binding protein 2 [Conchiformibius steedae]|uniref:peptidoglycan D,D-transpeptidase FtsI family protein n=1 Tax=Conchiformibius steedae TaxID=153493 RepID=UPI0026ED9688|nr:penicillin-binding protein 2 [Conchiformibius steedae]
MAEQPKTIKDVSPVTSNSRLMMVLIAICVAFVCLAVYSFFIHISHRTELSRFGENRLIRSIREPALRGMITDRDGTVLAVSRHLRVPTFNPQAIYEPKRKGDPVNWQTISDEQFRKMSEILQIPENELRAKFQDTSVKYLNLKKELSLSEADALKALKIPSLRFEERSERSYPTGNLFSHIVGFANSKGVGLEGLERTENERLKGEDGKQIVIRDRHGNIVEMLDSPENTPARSGNTLVLSVSQEIQRLARDELGKALKQFNAKAGGVVVLDAKTGEILAMTSMPDYDANFYTQFPEDSFRNYAVGVTMEPGSVMKPFIVAKAIDDGKIGRHTQFDTRPFAIGRKLIRDTHEYPSLTSEGILQKSSNVGTSHIAAMYPSQTLYDYFSAIGFGKKTNSGVSGEQNSPLKPANRWGQLDKAVMSYGYALTANMLQMAQAYTIFTNDGKLLPATIYKRDSAPEGTPVIRPATAKVMRDMMISVTRPGGSGINGAVPGYDVAGKTGTAKKVGANSGGYEDRYRASFVGFAPAQNPRLIVAVTIDDPRGRGYYGGTVAGPVFRNVMAGGLRALGVKPTRMEEAETPTVVEQSEAAAEEPSEP